MRRRSDGSRSTLMKEVGSESNKIWLLPHVEAVKFLRKWKQFDERSWKQKPTQKRISFRGVAGTGEKKNSIAFIPCLKLSYISAY